MIGIEDHRIIFYFGNDHRYILPRPNTHHQLHAFLNFHVLWKAILWKFDQHIFASFAISFVNRDIDSFLVATLHSTDAFIKTFDHRATAYFKLKRLTT